MSAHNQTKRSEASCVLSLPALSPSTAAGGCLAYSPEEKKNIWRPVQGPHLCALRQHCVKNRTGVVGIAFGQKKRGSSTWYFIVNLGRRSRAFNIKTLGRHEAWRRAVKCRANHELKIASRNAVVLAARNTSNN
jgi:hypothetical protein